MHPLLEASHRCQLLRTSSSYKHHAGYRAFACRGASSPCVLCVPRLLRVFCVPRVSESRVSPASGFASRGCQEAYTRDVAETHRHSGIEPCPGRAAGCPGRQLRLCPAPAWMGLELGLPLRKKLSSPTRGSQAVFIISLGPAVLFWIYFNKRGHSGPVDVPIDLACAAMLRPELL